jgi:hypothetical protein
VTRTRRGIVCIPVADFTPDTDRGGRLEGIAWAKLGKRLSTARRFSARNEARKLNTTARAGGRRATAKFGDACVSARKLVTRLFHSAPDVTPLWQLWIIYRANLRRLPCCGVRTRAGERNAAEEWSSKFDKRASYEDEKKCLLQLLLPLLSPPLPPPRCFGSLRKPPLVEDARTIVFIHLARRNAVLR